MKLPPNCQKWKISFSYSFFALSMSYWAYMPKMLFVDRMGWLEANTKTKSKNSEQKWKKHDRSSPFRDFVVPRFSPSSRSGPITVDTNTISSPLSIYMHQRPPIYTGAYVLAKDISTLRLNMKTEEIVSRPEQELFLDVAVWKCSIYFWYVFKKSILYAKVDWRICSNVYPLLQYVVLDETYTV